MRRLLVALAVLVAGLPVGAGAQTQPIVKRCVGDPPRQTEDPNSLPCVPFFEEDNGGDISPPSVTRDEIRVLLYIDVGAYNFENTPSAGTYVDLDEPPKPPCPKTWPVNNPDRDRCDNIVIRAARAFSIWGNDRYQTYARRAHYYAYFSGATTAAARRADAAANWQWVRPFAVLDQAHAYGNNEAYLDAMSSRGVMVLATPSLVGNETYRRNAPHLWTFWPDVEHRAALYTSYVCSRVAPFPVTHSGNTFENGRARKFGLYYTTDATEPGLRLFASLVKEGLRRCGIADPVEATFPRSGYVVDGDDQGVEQLLAVAKFLTNGVTTILWLGGVEGKFTQFAARLRYFPEIVLAGDLELDTNAIGRFQNQEVWKNAWATQLQLRMDRPEDTPGYIAYRQGDPGAPADDALFGSGFYRDHFMLFQAVQAAGALLTAGAVDTGFRAALPPSSSTSPFKAACFFDPGDYSCVKDAMEVWWDPAGVSAADPRPGCMRMVSEGRRFLAGAWPPGDDVFDNPADGCTSFEGRTSIRL